VLPGSEWLADGSAMPPAPQVCSGGVATLGIALPVSQCAIFRGQCAILPSHELLLTSAPPTPISPRVRCPLRLPRAFTVQEHWLNGAQRLMQSHRNMLSDLKTKQNIEQGRVGAQVCRNHTRARGHTHSSPPSTSGMERVRSCALPLFEPSEALSGSCPLAPRVRVIHIHGALPAPVLRRSRPSCRLQS
jgi:hypothetical protein